MTTMETTTGRRTRPQPATWEIAPIGWDDAAAFARLFRALHRFNADLDPRFALAAGWERHLAALIDGTSAGRPRLGLLARDRGRAAGFILARVQHDAPLWRHREWAEVEALYVEPAWRGGGLADDLMARALDWASGVGLSAVQLYVTASNVGALRFYERQGFRPAQMILRTLLPSAVAPRERGDDTHECG